MMCLVFINVLSRIVWRPILGTYEITGFLASVTISCALAHCATEKGHVAITLFTQRLSSRAKGVCEAIVATIGTGLFAVMSWQSVKYAFALQRAGEESMTLRLSFYPFVFGMAFGFLMLSLVNFIDILNSIKKVVRR
jgi:TRAP-type C4-dicarboxylate transport system permease small subunit